MRERPKCWENIIVGISESGKIISAGKFKVRGNSKRGEIISVGKRYVWETLSAGNTKCGEAQSAGKY